MAAHDILNYVTTLHPVSSTSRDMQTLVPDTVELPVREADEGAWNRFFETLYIRVGQHCQELGSSAQHLSPYKRDQLLQQYDDWRDDNIAFMADVVRDWIVRHSTNETPVRPPDIVSSHTSAGTPPKAMPGEEPDAKQPEQPPPRGNVHATAPTSPHHTNGMTPSGPPPSPASDAAPPLAASGPLHPGPGSVPHSKGIPSVLRIPAFGRYGEDDPSSYHPSVSPGYGCLMCSVRAVPCNISLSMPSCRQCHKDGLTCVRDAELSRTLFASLYDGRDELRLATSGGAELGDPAKDQLEYIQHMNITLLRMAVATTTGLRNQSAELYGMHCTIVRLEGQLEQMSQQMAMLSSRSLDAPKCGPVAADAPTPTVSDKPDETPAPARPTASKPAKAAKGTTKQLRPPRKARSGQ